MENKIQDLIFALFTLAGTIVGVGFLALPYATFKTGIFTLLFYFFLLIPLVSIFHFLYAKIVILTKGTHRLPGYAEIYLGKKGKILGGLLSSFSLIFALLAYLIVGSNFLSSLAFFNLSQQESLLLFFIPGAILVYFGIRPIAKIEILSFFLFLGVLFYLLFEGRPFLNFKNLFNFEKDYLFLPYGIVLFSLWGGALVPEVTELVKRKFSLAKIAIFFAIFLSFLLYLFFTILITSITGPLTTKNAILGLKYFFPDQILVFLFFFGILACFTSFLTLTLTLKKIFWYDIKIKKHSLCWFLASFLPLFLYFLGMKDFIKIVSFGGAVFLGAEAILILILYFRAEKEINLGKKILLLILGLFILFGIFQEILNFFKL